MSVTQPAPPVFNPLLPTPRPRRNRFLASFVVQAFALALLLKFGVIDPKSLESTRTYQAVELIAPATPSTLAPLPRRIAITPPPLRRLNELARLSPPAVHIDNPPLPPTVQRSQPEQPSASPATVSAPMPDPKRQVQTGLFSGSSAAPSSPLPAAKVQTGGFGDPNGVPANSKAQGAAAIAQVGAFDLPSGPGQGNGYAGSNGARATVASAGFGDSVAGPGGDNSRGTTPGGGLRDSGFADAATAPAQPPARQVARAEVFPAEIISKPKPSYTAEARAGHVEGEVLLEVVFGSNGKLRVVRVIRGLGHGLDEAAVEAAQQIRFKPAQRDGQPVDSTAKIHIIFQLA